MRPTRHARLGLLCLWASTCALATSAPARGDAVGLAGATVPPWIDGDDTPLPDYTHSVRPTRYDVAIYDGPTSSAHRRGSMRTDARFFVFGSRAGSGCGGRFFLVGPNAWTCSDVVEVDPEEPLLPALSRHENGLPYRYYFAGQNGATGYFNPRNSEDSGGDQELEKGWSVAIVEEKTYEHQRWGLTPHGRWFRLSELNLVSSFPYHGAELKEGNLDVAWVHTPTASMYSADKGGKVVKSLTRFDRVHVLEPAGKSGLVHVALESENDEATTGFMKANELAQHKRAEPPSELALDLHPDEKWIDVELASQTLVAYEGQKPVFATLVSTGKGPPASELGTHTGVHRIWVKILSTKMSNTDKEDQEHRYYIEDVPYVQFFDNAIALHGAFWHRNFGHVQSHGCVNLAPLDAEWLFFFTGPHLPKGWRAAYPTPYEPGTMVRVR